MHPRHLTSSPPPFIVSHFLNLKPKPFKHNQLTTRRFGLHKGGLRVLWLSKGEGLGFRAQGPASCGDQASDRGCFEQLIQVAKRSRMRS